MLVSHKHTYFVLFHRFLHLFVQVRDTESAALQNQRIDLVDLHDARLLDSFVERLDDLCALGLHQFEAEFLGRDAIMDANVWLSKYQTDVEDAIFSQFLFCLLRFLPQNLHDFWITEDEIMVYVLLVEPASNNPVVYGLSSQVNSLQR